MSDGVEQLMRANLLEVFNERDTDRRLAAIRRTYTEDVILVDAEGQAQGHDGLNAKVQEVLDGAPGFVFRTDGDFYQVQDLGYLAWTLGPENGPAVVRGVDMAIVRDGLLAKVYTVLFR